MRAIIGIILLCIVAVYGLDYAGIYDSSNIPFLGEYLDPEGLPFVGRYFSSMEGITLPRYTGDDIWGDIDNDGVMNVYDCCWTEPTNWLGVNFGTGCIDIDFDGIADPWDECPSTAGVLGSYESPLGCPRPVIPIISPIVTPPTPSATTTDANTSDTNATATNNPPVAKIVYNVVGNTVYVDGSSSTDSDGNVTSYLWNFGEGEVKTGMTASYDYTVKGKHIITLIVADNGGAVNMDSREITITELTNTGITGNTTLNDGTVFQKIFRILILIVIFGIIFILAFPKRSQGVRKKLKINKVEKATRKLPKPKPSSSNKPIFVKGHYRVPKGEGKGKGGIF